MKYYVSVSVVSLLCFVEYASSILCYDCNSAFDPRCGEHFDSFSLGIINCSLRDPPEHLDAPEPTFCRSIKMEIDGKVRIVRQCGYLAEEDAATTPCRRVVGNGDLFVTYCTCNTDLCNTAASHQQVTLFTIAMLLLLSLCY
ncbi:UPAR/Ly6 domain-containing protein crok-like [Anticarsia gemmatalis]|uniref:UPAR/Ly6 domain-containing protein crok-like n=1 Tax=Anticarsia gemmatalis TaxID=129554 RepID=UPI003F774A2E